MDHPAASPAARRGRHARSGCSRCRAETRRFFLMISTTAKPSKANGTYSHHMPRRVGRRLARRFCSPPAGCPRPVLAAEPGRRIDPFAADDDAPLQVPSCAKRCASRVTRPERKTRAVSGRRSSGLPGEIGCRLRFRRARYAVFAAVDDLHPVTADVLVAGRSRWHPKDAPRFRRPHAWSASASFTPRLG